MGLTKKTNLSIKYGRVQFSLDVLLKLITLHTHTHTKKTKFIGE